MRRGLDSDDVMRHWPGRARTSLRQLVVAAFLLAILAILFFTVGALIFSDDHHVAAPSWFAWADNHCEDAPFSCAVIAGVLVLPLPIVVGVLGLLTWRQLRIRRHAKKEAGGKAASLVQTTAPVDRIVGRDALCDALKRNLERREPIPHVLVGGVGTGKTAVLVHLTRLLAQHGAVPIPMRLRDVQDSKDLDFGSLARKAFLRIVDSQLLTQAEGDKIWRNLREQGRIVVLADGLEEALARKDDRDTTIRSAIADARHEGLPLVITSRPHPALRYLDCALLPLEPLSEGAARRFILGDRRAADPKVRLIVDNGEVVEAPLYMQLARALHEKGLLDKLDTRCATRLALRVHLLDTWYEKLAAGELLDQVRHSPGERERALSDLSAIAIVGLLADSLEVNFLDVDRTQAAGLPVEDPRWAAGVGDRLEIVAAHPRGVRFQHSVIQAYLGSRRLRDACDTGFERVVEGVRNGPGRELLMALVMSCWHDPSAEHRARVRKLLRDAAVERAGTRRDAKTVEMLSAAAEIDGMDGDREEHWIVDAVERCWPETRQNKHDEHLEPKLAAIARLGELARSGGLPTGREHLRRRAREELAPAGGAKPIDADALRALWEIGVADDEAYAARIAVAQEIGTAGSAAAALFHADFVDAVREARRLYHAGAAGTLPRALRRRLCLVGWTLPMIASSPNVRPADQEKLGELVGEWVGLVCDGVDPSIEEACARGFKFEANRRPDQVDGAMRSLLAEEAERMLETCRLWFTRITLFHAFTLWALSNGSDGAEPGDETEHRHRRRRREARDRARKIVAGWSGTDEHPFVVETRELCREALRTGHPAQYIWIDESGTLSKLGVGRSRPNDAPSKRLWISPATGWMTLQPRAFKLIGEISVALNLAEGTDSTRREQRLRQLGSAPTLPLCLTQRSGQEALRPLGVSENGGPRPGCTCLPGCKARLCPYPPPGQPPLRGELGEAFSREQGNAVDGALKSAVRRDGVRPRDRKAVWRDLEQRARGAAHG